jgi:DNA-binding CsgD family transcriptional regulator
MTDVLKESLIDRIYDAAAKPELWKELLVALADHVRSAGGVAIGILATGQGSAFCHCGRYRPPANCRHMINPWTIEVQKRPVGDIVRSHEIMPLRDLRRTEFYEDMLAPSRLDHSVIATICRDNKVNFALTIMRGDKVGPYTEEDIGKLRELMPHLRRSARMRLNLESYHALSLHQQEILDRINTGVILVDEIGRFHCVNQAADDILCEEDGLRMLGNVLIARDLKASRQLTDMIMATAAGGAGGTIVVPRPPGRDPLFVLAVPLRGMIRESLIGPGPRPVRQTVALFIKDPARDYPGGDSMLTPLFELTPAEVRVALALGRGEGVKRVAVRLNLSENTVKTHAKHIYEKIGVSNQAELVHKLSRLVSF